MTLNCVIIDDEPLAAELLTNYGQRTPFLNVIGTFNSAVEAIRIIRENKVDLIFLDIQMPELSGLEFAKILPRDTKLVFTTAFSQYAVEGYKVNAFDYLLKPISYEDFLTVACKALAESHESQKANMTIHDRFIFIRSEYKLVKIMFDDILYIEGLKDYVKIFLDNGQPPIMSLINLKKLEDFLPKPEFMRAHRSYIVHMTKVQLIDRLRFVFDDQYIPISDSYKAGITAYLDSHTPGLLSDNSEYK